MAESIIERNKRIGADVKRASFIAKQRLPYEMKKKYAALRAHEFVSMCDQHDKNYHVSVGGLDSITLFLFYIPSGYVAQAYRHLILKIAGIKSSIRHWELSP